MHVCTYIVLVDACDGRVRIIALDRAAGESEERPGQAAGRPAGETKETRQAVDWRTWQAGQPAGRSGCAGTSLCLCAATARASAAQAGVNARESRPATPNLLRAHPLQGEQLKCVASPSLASD